MKDGRLQSEKIEKLIVKYGNAEFTLGEEFEKGSLLAREYDDLLTKTLNLQGELLKAIEDYKCQNP